MTYLRFLREATRIMSIAKAEGIECSFSAKVKGIVTTAMLTIHSNEDFPIVVAMTGDERAESKLVTMKAQVELMVFNARRARTRRM